MKIKRNILAILMASIMVVGGLSASAQCVYCAKILPATPTGCWFCRASSSGYHLCWSECNFCSANMACPASRPPTEESVGVVADDSTIRQVVGAEALDDSTIRQAAQLDMHKAVVLAMARTMARKTKSAIGEFTVAMNTSIHDPLRLEDIGFWLKPNTVRAARYHRELNRAIKNGDAIASQYLLSVVGSEDRSVTVSVNRTDVKGGPSLRVILIKMNTGTAEGTWVATSVGLQGQ